MPDLAQFQRRFADTLLRNTDGDGDLSHPAFAVYRNTWRKALVDALEANFPVVEELIGSNAFGMLTSHYVSANPVSSPVLAGYGAGLAAFIEASPLAESVPYLADVARLEYLIAEIRHTPDMDSVDAGMVGSLPAEALDKLELTTIPAARIAIFATPAVTIWKAHQQPGRIAKMSPEWKAEYAIIARSDGRTAVRAIDRATAGFANALLAGAPLGAAAEAVTSTYPDADIAAILSAILSSGAFRQL